MNIQSNEIYTFKLLSGEEVIAKVVNSADNYVIITKPLSIAFTQQGVQMMPTLFTGDPDREITVNKSAIVMSVKPREDVVNHYIQGTTGIQPVTSNAASKILMG